MAMSISKQEAQIMLESVLLFKSEIGSSIPNLGVEVLIKKIQEEMQKNLIEIDIESSFQFKED